MQGMDAMLMTPERAQRMFQRVLRNWAVDALRLRREGLDRPTARRLISGGCTVEKHANDVQGVSEAQFRSDAAQE